MRDGQARKVDRYDDDGEEENRQEDTSEDALIANNDRIRSRRFGLEQVEVTDPVFHSTKHCGVTARRCFLKC